MSHPKVSAWLNKAAFVDSSAFTLGDAPRNLPRTRTDAWKGLDLSLMKSLSFGDLFKLQTRAKLSILLTRQSLEIRIRILTPQALELLPPSRQITIRGCLK